MVNFPNKSSGKPYALGHDCDRRSFLKGVAGVGASGSMLSGILGSLAEAASTNESGEDGPIFLLIHQSGGNDSLNTVIPHSRDDSEFYYRTRPNLAIEGQDSLDLQDGFGLHPALSGMKELWDDGDLAIVNGVGHPRPNQSHFKNGDIWASASLEEDFSSGWLGRFFEHQCSDLDSFDSLIGLETTNQPSLGFRTASGRSALTVRDSSLFNFNAGHNNPPFQPNLDNRFTQALLGKLEDSALTGGEPTLDYARFALQAAFRNSNEIQDLLRSTEASFPFSNFPNTDLGEDLGNIARYIAGGSRTSVYFTIQNGYDTHSGQYISDGSGKPLMGRHASLLESFDQAFLAFCAEMKRQGKWDRVLVMSYSEFSRKVFENGTNGTDHGAAESIFIAGGAVNGGLFGEMPSLADDDLVLNGSMNATTDFRQVYRTILERFMNLNAEESAQILNIDPQLFPLVDFLSL